jgi:hypothetical protein
MSGDTSIPGKEKVGSKVQLFAENRRGRDDTCLKTTFKKIQGLFVQCRRNLFTYL